LPTLACVVDCWIGVVQEGDRRAGAHMGTCGRKR
jgi:hypothetical protein